MHRTLKAETAKPPSGSMRAQQRRFDAFLDDYNNERPHEAIGQATPSSLYQPSKGLCRRFRQFGPTWRLSHRARSAAAAELLRLMINPQT
jgi:hypothetical protein